MEKSLGARGMKNPRVDARICGSATPGRLRPPVVQVKADAQILLPELSLDN